jgi:seryl-tRNA synthetase
MRKQQQQQQEFVLVKGGEPPLQGQQQQFQLVQYTDTWKRRQQQVQTIQKQYKRIQIQPNFPIYRDKKTNKLCLFHGTTTDNFDTFTQDQKTIFPKFFLTFDLQEAIRYANTRYQQRKQQGTTIHPALLVFMLKDEESILQGKGIKKQEIAGTYLNLKKPETIASFLKNTTVEMITIKQPSTQKP